MIYAKYFSYKYVHYKQLKLFCFILLRWFSYFLGTSWWYWLIFWAVSLVLTLTSTANHLPPSPLILTTLLYHTKFPWLHPWKVLWSISLFLLHGSYIFNILCPVCSLFLLCKCPNHLGLTPNFISKHSTWVAPLMYSFLIHSITPNKNLNNSTTSSSTTRRLKLS